MKDTRETIRFSDNPIDNKIMDYLGRVHKGYKSAFIKEALEMYIQAIEQGLYKCPFIGEVKNEDKFLNILNKKFDKIDEGKENYLFDNIFDDEIFNIDNIFE